MILRPMTEADCTKVSIMEKEVFSDPWSRAVFSDCLKQKNYHMTVATSDTDNGDIWGYCCFYTVLDECEIANVCVRQDKRRMGIADRMLDQIIETGKENHTAVFFLEVRESNNPARHLYEKKGFVQNGLRKNYYSCPTENAVLMEYIPDDGQENHKLPC